MYLKGFKHREIQASLGVSSGFISKWTQRYIECGIAGLKLQYKGSAGYLTPTQRQAVITWLQRKSYWQLHELRDYLEDTYQVVFKSRESYYTLGNSEATVDFIKLLVAQAGKSRIAMIWDGASYPCSKELKVYLELVNHGLEASKWKVICLRFAPNDPSQNPMKVLFELVIHRQTFSFPKLFSYSSFLQMT